MGDAEEHLYVTVEYFLFMEIIYCIDYLPKEITLITLLPLLVGHPAMLVVEEGYNHETILHVFIACVKLLPVWVTCLHM